MKFRIKRGDEVVVIAGAHKGERGKVLEVRRNKTAPDRSRVVVEGVALCKVHKKQRSPEDTESGIVEREGSIHYSNVMTAERYDQRRAD